MAKNIIKTERTLYMYALLQNIAVYVLRSAQCGEDGRFYNSLTVMLYCAFCLEAYLNHIGSIEIQEWDKIERSLNPKKKLEKLTEMRHFSPVFSERPFKSFDPIFQFRKQIVHGRTECVRTERVAEHELGTRPEIPTTDWEAAINLETASRFYEDCISMITQLHRIFGFHDDPFFTEYRKMWEVKPLQEDE